MPKPPLSVRAGELTADEIVSALNEGRRVLVTVNMMGTDRTVTLRYDGTTYYCDTPTRLLKHKSEPEIRACILDMGYARDE